MKSNRWLPIIIMLCLTGLGVFVGVKTILNTKHSKPLINSATKSLISTEPAVTGDLQNKQGNLGVLRGIDKENSKIGVYLLDDMKETVFTYNLATSVKSINDEELVMQELPLGSVIKLEVSSTGVLSKVEVSKEAWDYKGVRNLVIDEVLSKMQIGESNYTYDAGLTVISGRDNVSLRNIDTSKDTLEIRGIGEKILSIDITTGHGVLDFAEYDDFIGGNIEIGYDVFDLITDNMKYVLREGKYKVVMRNGKLSVNKVVTIKRDRTEVLRLSDFAGEMDKSSKVVFNISPSNAAIYIDGKEIVNMRSELDYGEYLIKVMADGYIGWEKVVTISKPKTIMNIALAQKKEKFEEDDDDGMAEPLNPVEEVTGDDEDDLGDTGSRNNEDSEDDEIKVRTDSTKNIYFRKPEGATVSFDGREIGDIPCEMIKVTGEHEIALKKDGYETQTFTVEIEDDGEDAVFGFPEMVKERQQE
ncbi:MAG: PEGA domain-containing protein [Catonella sp.]|uniref:PEGA domain-containing protein n=1 Tax=Catonella sp. TaxID=2382125 RepID=UPI003FA0259E